MKSRNYEKVEKLFQRCLMKVLNIDLWKCYLNYVKETKSGLSSYREKMSQAYDFAIEKIGMDIMSYQLWADYVTFLKSVEAVGSYAENQRITAVRRVYQRGCVNPMLNIEQLWREYNAYEQSINPIIAKKMIDDRTRDYINARRVSKELEAMTRGLQRNNPAIPPNPANPDEMKQVSLWKKYIEWEKENPIRTEDLSLLTKRVMFAYEQCLLCLGQHPDVWYEAAQYLVESSKRMVEKGDTNSSKILADEAASMYERAISNLMKNNMLLHFAYADFEEGRMKFDKVHSIYEKLLECKEIDQTLTYIQYMKFARRAEGIKAARLVFKKAREDQRVRFHVFVAAALMEYYCTKEKQIAFKIFELGLKRFGDEPDYLLAYIDYMSHLNEDNNTRVLFERVLTSGSLPPDKSGKIWDEYLEFECNVGDLSSMLKVERRRLEAFKKEYDQKTTCLLVDRYRFLDLFPCTPEELKSIGYKDSRARTVVAGIPVMTQPSADTSNQQNDDHEPQIGVGLPVPDLSQMLPYRPKVNPLPGLHTVPGGEFPEPPAAAALLRSLPPPRCFNGPFPIMDELLDKFMHWKLPDEKEWLQNMNSNTGEYDPHRLLKVSKGRKRSASHDDSDTESKMPSGGGPGVPPAKDIYRSRQQKRVR